MNALNAKDRCRAASQPGIVRQSFATRQYGCAGRTSIRSARYLAERQILDLEFQGGTLYRYHDVPDMVFRELLTAESKGAFVNPVIKPHFSFTQLTSGA